MRTEKNVAYIRAFFCYFFVVLKFQSEWSKLSPESQGYNETVFRKVHSKISLELIGHFNIVIELEEILK